MRWESSKRRRNKKMAAVIIVVDLCNALKSMLRVVSSSSSSIIASSWCLFFFFSSIFPLLYFLLNFFFERQLRSTMRTTTLTLSSTCVRACVANQMPRSNRQTVDQARKHDHYNKEAAALFFYFFHLNWHHQMKEKVPIQPIQSVSSVFLLEIGVKAMPSTRPATSCCRQSVSHSIARFDCPAAKTLHIIINWWQYVGYCSVLFNPIVVPWFVGSTWRLVFCLFNLERTMEGRKDEDEAKSHRVTGWWFVIYYPRRPLCPRGPLRCSYLLFSSLFLFFFFCCPLELFIFVLARLLPRQSAALPTGSWLNLSFPLSPPSHPNRKKKSSQTDSQPSPGSSSFRISTLFLVPSLIWPLFWEDVDGLSFGSSSSIVRRTDGPLDVCVPVDILLSSAIDARHTLCALSVLIVLSVPSSSIPRPRP